MTSAITSTLLSQLCVFELFFTLPALLKTLFLGKKNKLRVYYLSWLRNKILRNDPEVEKKQGWTTVGDLEGCVHYKVGKYHIVLCVKICQEDIV